MAAEENIKVAVRLRPLLPNIKEEANGKLKRVIYMDELSSSVSLINPDNPVDTQKFTFDSILWSFDGYSEQADGYLAPDNKAVSEEMYCDQKQVYEEIGKELVQNLWNGHNTSLFTFGQGKSGKSWTLLGLGVNKVNYKRTIFLAPAVKIGVVPQVFTDLFKGVREKEKTFQQNGSTLEIRLSMADICNEKVKDLLPAAASSSSTSKLKNSLKIREHLKKGFYVEGLRSVLIVNHEDIQQRLEEGLVNRAVYLTSCNATWSNSMTIITVSLVQKIRNHRGDEVTRAATLEFFDLPACELMGHCDTDQNITPENLKRNGIHILANCVDLLLEESIGKSQEYPIPFHSHAITKLLRSALNGNSKTWMLTALSPFSNSYKTSLYILHLAEKVRMLTTKSILSEEVTSKLVRELKGDNEKLKKLVSLGDVDTSDYYSSSSLQRFENISQLSSSERDVFKRRVMEDMKAQIRENEKEIRNLTQSVEERLKPFKSERNDVGKKIENDRKNKCHIFNLCEDSQATGKIIYILPLGTVDFGQASNSTVGKAKDNNHFVSFCGPGIREHHGIFSYNNKDGKISIKPAGPNCRIVVNEQVIVFDAVLSHNDRILLGSSQMWMFQNPKETWLEKYAFSHKIHYEHIVEDVAVKSEQYQYLNSDLMGESLQKQFVKLVPALEDAKAITEDLNQNYTFQPLHLHPIEALLRDNNGSNENGAGGSSSNNESKVGYYSDKAELYSDDQTDKLGSVLVKVQNMVDGSFSYWSNDMFFNRLEMLKEAYMQFLEDGDAPIKEIDAFIEPSDMDVPIGYSILSLKPLAHLINIENSAVPVLDYVTFQAIGTISVSLHFCDENGEKINDDEVYIETPDELLDDNLTVVMTIKEPNAINLQYKDIYCKYKFLEEDTTTVTKYLDAKASTFMGISNKHEKKYLIEPVTDNTINIILTQYLVLSYFGKQRAHKLLNLSSGGLSNFGKPYSNNHEPLKNNPVEMENTVAELKIKSKAEQRHRQRLDGLKALIEQSETLGEESVPVTIMRSLFEAKSKKFVDQNLEEHKELLTAPPEEPPPKQLPPELKALKRFSEVCNVI